MSKKLEMIVKAAESNYGPLPHKFLGAMDADAQRKEQDKLKSDGQAYSAKIGGTCDLCSTPVVDRYYFKGSIGDNYYVGSSCATKIFNYSKDPNQNYNSNEVKFKKAKAAIEKKKRDARKAKKIAAGIEKIKAEHGPLIDALDALAQDPTEQPRTKSIAKSLFDSATKKGKLSDKQIDLAKKLLSQ